MSASEWAAWYAAIVATVALLWEIIRYFREGLRLRVTVQPDMVLVGTGVPGQGETHIMINVRHVSGPPTTITHIAFRKFKSVWHERLVRLAPSWLLRQFRVSSDGAFWVPSQLNCQYPHRLEIGTEWQCALEQSKLDEARNDGGELYAVVAHTLRKGELRKRVMFKD